MTNSQLIKDSWELTSGADYSTPMGWVEGAVGVVGGVAGVIDGAANVVTLGGKAAVTTGLKSGIKQIGKGVATSVAENAAEVAVKQGAEQAAESGAKAASQEVAESATKNPTFKLSKSDPAVGEHAAMVERAQDAGQPKTLTRNGGRRDAERNRYLSQKEIRKNQGGPSRGNDYDEYPYASSKEGGTGAHVEEISSQQNQEAGRRLGKFYQENNIKKGDSFNVVVD